MANAESGRVEPLFTGDNPVGLYLPSPVLGFKTSCFFGPIKVDSRKTALDASLVGEQQRWIHLKTGVRSGTSEKSSAGTEIRVEIRVDLKFEWI